MTDEEYTVKLRLLSKKVKRARAAADKLAAEENKLMKDCYSNSGLSLQKIADATGVTKPRVWQIVKDYVKPGGTNV